MTAEGGPSADDSRFATAFDLAAAEYERGRPAYAETAIERLAAELKLAPSSTVIDLAAGTGKLTRDLVRRFERVIAIEPLAQMRDELRRGVPGAEAIEGTAEAMPVGGGCADAVVVAQAFHWFDGRRALDEIARVLRPRGGLGLLWNTTPWEHREGPWFALVDDVLERGRADLSTLRRHASGRWLEAFEGETRFEPLADATLENTRRMSREEFLDGFASRSYVAALEAADRDQLLADIAALLERPDAPVEDDKVVVPMRTVAFWTRLTPVT